MERQALGLIETVGLVGAIEATDAAAKASSIVVVRAEVTEASLVTIYIEGELAAVQAAVQAGVAAGNRVGKVNTFTVIPRPHGDLDGILNKPNQKWKGKSIPRPSAPEPSRIAQTPFPSDRPSRSAPTARLTLGTQDYDSMTVSALRRLARRRGDLPISGREIANADKDMLVRLLKQAGSASG